MKNMFENEEVFQAYAQIDYCYWGIKELQKDLNKPRSPIEMAIDVATGYDKHVVKENKSAVIELLKTIIKCKKLIEADYSGDEKALNEIILLPTH